MKTTTYIELDKVSSTYVNYNLALEIIEGDCRVTAPLTEDQAKSLHRQLDEKIKRLEEDRLHEAKRQLEEASDSE